MGFMLSHRLKIFGAKPPALAALKVLIVKKRARALGFREPAYILGLRGYVVGDNTRRRWVIIRCYPQAIVGDNTMLSTMVGNNTMLSTAFSSSYPQDFRGQKNSFQRYLCWFILFFRSVKFLWPWPLRFAQ